MALHTDSGGMRRRATVAAMSLPLGQIYPAVSLLAGVFFRFSI
jgi:hypothetical protein